MISSSLQYTICDVCRILDYNTEKKLCGYCSMCDARICEADQSKWGRRLLAAAKRKLEPGYQGLPNYEELANEGLKNESSTNSGKHA